MAISKSVPAFVMGLAGLLGAAGARAAYPERPLTLVVPFPVTGSPDIAGTPRISKVVRVMHTLSTPTVTDRLVLQTQQMLASRLAQTVKIERRSGGKTIAGAHHAASAKADGYTLLLAGNATITIYPALYERLPFDPVNDFVPVAAVAKMPIMLAVEKQNPAPGADALS